MLPSQTARGGGGGGGGRAFSRSRRKRGLLGSIPPAAWIVLIAGGAGIAWMLLGGGAADEGEAATDAEPALAAAPPRETNPQPITAPSAGADTPMTRSAERPAMVEPPGRRPEPVVAAAARDEDADRGPVEIVQGGRPTRDPGFVLPGAEREAGVDPAAFSGDTGAALAEGERLLRANKPVEARQVLNATLLRIGRDGSGAPALRDMLASISNDLTFSPRIHPRDVFAMQYEVQPGDTLDKISTRTGLATDWRLIQRVNRISDPRRIRVGQKLKLVRGPFHVVVDKSDYRLDVYAGPPGNENEWMYIRSYTVGLGEEDSTPTGQFVVRADSKLVNPHWVNPRTGERFDADNPENPIGERWIGIRGVGEYDVHTGYGLHGTIDPDSMGEDLSMGCVRMLPGEIDQVYEMLVEEISRVVVVP